MSKNKKILIKNYNIVEYVDYVVDFRKTDITQWRAWQFENYSYI